MKQFKLFFLALKVTGPSLFVSNLLFKHKLVYHHKGNGISFYMDEAHEKEEDKNERVI